MEARTGIAIVLLLLGCSQSQIQDEPLKPHMNVSPRVVSQPASKHRQAPQRLKLQLTLDRPEDLKAKVGDQIVKGQVISKRSLVRASLVHEREILLLQLQQLQTPMVTVVPSYATEQAEVELAQIRVKQARDAISNFHADSPWTDYARRKLLISESTKLGKLEAQYQEAKGALTLEIAKLNEVKRQDRVKQRHNPQTAELIAKIRSIENKFKSTGIVRSPYNGRIQSIKWLKQTNQELQLEMTVSIKSNFDPFIALPSLD